MFERLDPSATKVLEAAFSEATSLGDDAICTEHLLLALATTDTVTARLLAEAGADGADIRRVFATRGRRPSRHRDHEEREDATAPDGHRDDVDEIEGDVSRVAARGSVRDERCPEARGEPSERDELASQIPRHKALGEEERTDGDGAGSGTQQQK